MLTQAERDAWNAAAPGVQSARRLGKSGPLTAQVHFEGINAARACLGLPEFRQPPAPVRFGPNPVSANWLLPTARLVFACFCP